MIEGYDKWSIPSSDDLGGTYILELHIVRASNTRAPSIVGIQLGTYLRHSFLDAVLASVTKLDSNALWTEARIVQDCNVCDSEDISGSPL